MKKLIKITAFGLLTCLTLAFAGCQKPKTNYEKLCDNISYMQTGLYIASDENFDVKLTTTTQEELFIADGKANAQVEMSLLTIIPHDTANLSKTYEFTLEGSNSSVSGTISKSRLGINLICNVEDFKNIGEPKTLTLKDGDNSYTFQLENKCSDITDGKGALEIAYNHYQERIDSAMTENSFDRECYIKLLSQTNENNEAEYYWYVSFIKDKNDYWSTIIDPTTNEVVSSRESERKQENK
ncbi:MAG: hypothetical protein K2O95_02245, partial [Clostridia bacterium]|nr:hypothetical protein [Clostridia bacterium]MDE6758637.1 hypothetical protein [Clostridia bacterium]MDE7078922.1 hypothetical protein [Clostridia bacterium]